MSAALRRPRRRAQAGSVSVEFGLVLPIFLLLLLGGLHFGRVLTTRHRLADATNFAIRAAAVRGVTNAGAIRAIVQDRLGGAASDCSALSVAASTAVDAGLTRLQVDTTCDLATGFGAALLGAIGPDRLTVSAAMPL